MISEPIFSEIVIRHIKAILDEVKEHEGLQLINGIIKCLIWLFLL